MPIQLFAAIRLLSLSSLVLITACSRTNDASIPEPVEEVVEQVCEDITVTFDQPLAAVSLRTVSQDVSTTGLLLDPFFDTNITSYQVNLPKYLNYLEVFTSHAPTGPAGPITSLTVDLLVDAVAGSSSSFSRAAIDEQLVSNVWSSRVYIPEGATDLVLDVEADLNFLDAYNDCSPTPQQLSLLESYKQKYVITVNRIADAGAIVVDAPQLHQDSDKRPYFLNESALDEDDMLGHSVSIFGDTLVVGVPGDDNGDSTYYGVTDVTDDSRATLLSNLNVDNTLVDSGAVYIFERFAVSDWRLVQILKAENPSADDRFGHSVSIDGDVIAVSALYEDSAATEVNGVESNELAPNSGAAYIYRRDDTGFRREAYVKPPVITSGNAGFFSAFGDSVLVSGDTLFVTAPDRDLSEQGADTGSVDVYGYDEDDGWFYSVTISSGLTRAGDRFGQSISASGDYVLIGAPGDDSNVKRILNSARLSELSDMLGDDTFFTTTNSGAVHEFVRSGISWGQTSYIKAPNADNNDAFGKAVGLGSYLWVGAPGEDGASSYFDKNMDSNDLANSGAVYAYYRSQGRDVSLFSYVKSFAPQAGAEFGREISSDRLTTLISAPSESRVDEGGAHKGITYVLEATTSLGALFYDSRWVFDPSDSFAERSGASIDVSNGKLAIGAPGTLHNIFDPGTDLKIGERANAGAVLLVE